MINDIINIVCRHKKAERSVIFIYTEDINSFAEPVWIVNSECYVINENIAAEDAIPFSRAPDVFYTIFTENAMEAIKNSISSLKGGEFYTEGINLPCGNKFLFFPYTGENGEIFCIIHAMGSAAAEESGIGYAIPSELIGTAYKLKDRISENIYNVIMAREKLGTREIDDEAEAVIRNCYRSLRDIDNFIVCNQRMTEEDARSLNTVDFWGECAELFNDASAVLKKSGKKFYYTLPESTVYVKCSFKRMSIALLNIITNAFQHNANGVELTVEGRDSEEGISLIFTDNGRGLTEDERMNLFNPFGNYLDIDNSSVGLGLTAVKTIVEEAGGKLAVTRGEGQSFGIWLPTAEPQGSMFREPSPQYIEDRFSVLYKGLSNVIDLPI